MDNKNHLPWVEKYRPEILTDIISHKEIIQKHFCKNINRKYSQI